MFSSNQDRGERIFQQEAKRAEAGVFAGDVAWKLYDTYGFPVDLTSSLYHLIILFSSHSLMFSLIAL